MSSHQFSQVYKTWSNLELFQLLQNKDDYQPEAVEAATLEINSRNLSREELETLQANHEELQFKKQNTAEKKLAKKLETGKQKLIADLNPFAEKTITRNIRLLCYALAFIVLYNFISDFRMIHTIITHVYLNSYTVLMLMPYIFIPIGIYYFWKKQKFGWSIITIWLVLLVVTIVTSYISELRTADDVFRFFPRRGPGYYLSSFLIFGGLLTYINTKKITEAFNIDRKFQLQTGVIAALIVAVHWIITFF